MPTYPTDLDKELDEILGMKMWQTGPIAHALRFDGKDIPKKAEREQSHVLHWLIGMYLEHGKDWRVKVAEKLTEIATKAA